MSSPNEKDIKILQDIFFSALDAANPIKQMKRLKFKPPKGKTFFAAVGKGSARLAKAFKDNFDGRSDGIIVMPENEESEDIGYQVLRSSHPIPSRSGILASNILIKRVSSLGENDLFIFCISGGSSSLLPAPPDGFTLSDEQSLNRGLLRSGLTISQMNAFRSKFSRIKGGLLGEAAYPCPIINLVVCDIPGNDISLVGSGPTFKLKDPKESLNTIIKKGLFTIPQNSQPLFISSFKDKKLLKINIKENHILSSSVLLMEAAKDYIKKKYKLNSIILSSDFGGEAALLAKFHADVVREIKSHNRPCEKPVIILSGGESEIRLPKKSGKGGRNSHFALALSIELDGLDGVTALIADSDGIDGSEKNAGAFTRSETKKNINLTEYLTNYDSYSAHEKLKTLFFTGATGVNVNDFRAIIVR